MSNISDYFNNYKVEAFRLELLPAYKVPQEEEGLTLFKENGTVKQNESLINYIKNASTKILEGKRHIRTRVIPNPMTDYFLFECHVGYIPQSKVGFEINFLEQEKFASLIKEFRTDVAKTDFWLFDKETLFQMIYDSEGKFVEVKLNSSAELLDEALKIRTIFINNAHSLSYVIDKYL